MPEPGAGANSFHAASPKLFAVLWQPGPFLPPLRSVDRDRGRLAPVVRAPSARRGLSVRAVGAGAGR